MPETQGSLPRTGILDRIVQTKWREVEALLPRSPELASRAGDAPPPRDLRSSLARKGVVALMAEVKRRSPGAGAIRPDLVPSDLGRMYEEAGASAVSVLTDPDYFGGSLDDLRQVREAVELPVFRKDFVLHRVQLLEGRAAGADGILLIARILPEEVLRDLHAEAGELGLTPIVEVHHEAELEKALSAGAVTIGVNNRNLQTFTTSLEVTLNLLPSIPAGTVVISESGISAPSEVDRLGAAGVHGILVGETILRAESPGKMVAELTGRRRVARRAEEPA